MTIVLAILIGLGIAGLAWVLLAVEDDDLFSNIPNNDEGE